MNQQLTNQPSSKMRLGDVYYVFFRHKWKIASISAGGIAAALLLPLIQPVPFQSEAKLYIRYVLESKSPTQGGANDSWIKSPDERGDSIINTELEILTSLDLAQQVADAIGPEKILGKFAGPSSPYQAAARIRKELTVEVPRNSSVIRVAFQHSNPEIVQPVLQQLIHFYFKKHGQIHAVGAFDEFLAQETEQLHSRLVQTEGDLRAAKAKAGVISLEDSKHAHAELISRIQQGILDAEAELAAHQAGAKEMARLLHADPAVATNEAVVTYEKAAEYRRLCGLLNSLERKEQELLVQFKAESPLVKEVQTQMAANKRRKQQLELEEPGLLGLQAPESRAAGAEPGWALRTDLVAEKARVTALESKIRTLTEQLDKVGKQTAVMNEAEASITELQRKKELEEADYAVFRKNLKQSLIEEKLGAGKVSNISTIQEPSPPFRVLSTLRKQIVAVLLSSIAGAFALAFLIEFHLDQSLKRPRDIETKLGLPLFVTIPWMGQNAKAGVQPFYEALRDRLLTHFELRNLTHKPKLVAVTSAARGCGVSTVAAGLAASLSETGDGKVLLVDMNRQSSLAHEFYQGELCRLDDALELEKRSSALVQHNLYVVTEATNNDSVERVLPKRFTQLVPRLKASDYDYIIFDMPAVSQTSTTPRLARFMDMVLLVVESEKNDGEMVKRASLLLSESRANIGTVLNKYRTYVPQRFRQEL